MFWSYISSSIVFKIIFGGLLLLGLAYGGAKLTYWKKKVKQEKLNKHILKRSLESEEDCAYSLTDICP